MLSIQTGHSIFTFNQKNQMAGLSLDVLRIGKKYSLVNYGDRYEFQIERILGNGDFKVKDLTTLERYHLKDTIKFGKGKDFEIRELDS